MSDPIRVIKLGGSLLEMDGLVERFRAWRAGQAPMRDVMVVGGGRMADAIRDAFARHGLSDEDAHWLCVQAMGVSAALVARLLPEATLVYAPCEVAASNLAVLAPEAFLRKDESGPRPLPHTWDVTSDSIAARVADVLGAVELVLLKSALPGASVRLRDWAAAGYVDRFFPSAAAGLRVVRAVNLRDLRFEEARSDDCG